MEVWSVPPPSQCYPVSLLTGFLGSGKTTVLNHLVKHPDLKKTLVIVNEFGEIGIDHDLVAHSKDDIVVELSSGCLCCTIRGDLVRTLGEAIWRFSREGKPWFDRVVIETTGLADPAPILHTLMTDPLIAARYRLDGIVTTVDAATGMATLNRQIEAVKQAAVADRLLLTKVDLAAGDQIDALVARLKFLNPAAPIIHTLNGVVEPGRLFDAGLYNPKSKSMDVQRWLNAEAYASAHPGHPEHDGECHDHHEHGHDDHGVKANIHGGLKHHRIHDPNRHDDHIKAVCLTIDEPMKGENFDRWLEALMLIKGPDILRIKGIINIRDLPGPFVIHGVQHIFHPPVSLRNWPSTDRRTRIVFIGYDMDESFLRVMLKMCSQDGPTQSASLQSLRPGHPGDDDLDVKTLA